MGFIAIKLMLLATKIQCSGLEEQGNDYSGWIDGLWARVWKGWRNAGECVCPINVDELNEAWQ